jgi:hypothetical protein
MEAAYRSLSLLESERAMSVTVWLSANTLHYPQAGGHMWVFLNWALGLRDLGCNVVWLEGIVTDGRTLGPGQVSQRLAELKVRLAPYGFDDHIALWANHGQLVPRHVAEQCIDLEAARDADLLINVNYRTPAEVIERFRRSALIDIDPGLLQIWLSDRSYNFTIPPHDVLFTIGETVGQPGSKIPDLGIAWHYTPPCVALSRWPAVHTTEAAPLTTISHWVSRDWLRDEKGQLWSNEKRTGFWPYLDLPRHTSQFLELALQLRSEEEADRDLLREHGWRVRDAWTVAGTPWDYQKYVQQSLGEFSWVKPSCVRLQNAWISDRTLCYLASGKPAIIEHTGPSRFLPDRAGLLRFRNFTEAVECLETAAADYTKHSQLARSFAEEHFDAKNVTMHLLERALT